MKLLSYILLIYINFRVFIYFYRRYKKQEARYFLIIIEQTDSDFYKIFADVCVGAVGLYSLFILLDTLLKIMTQGSS